MTMLDHQDKLVAEIKRLKAERNAVILSHNYQLPEVQDIADHVGDSFALSRLAAKTTNDVIVFCGVHFMAESAAVLSPDKTVLLPALDAGCPMADMIDVDTLIEKKNQHPDAKVVVYVNSSAAVKAEADICCTSSNAVSVVRSIDSPQILFAPDQNLGHWVAKQVPEKQFIFWEGFCRTHHRVTVEDVKKARAAHPDAVLCIHPECKSEVVEMGDFVGSTAQIIAFCKSNSSTKFIIGTEMGILHALQKDSPNKDFYILSQGFICPNMKRTTLAYVYKALLNMEPVISVDEPVRSKARRALERMLNVAN